MFSDSVTTVGLRPSLLAFSALTLGLLLLTLVFYVQMRRAGDRYTKGNLVFGAQMSGVVAVLSLVFLLACMFPFSTHYYQMYRVTGHVQSVSNVLDSGTGTMTQTPVVQLDTVDRPMVVNDPRVVALEGRQVTFTCEVSWHYAAADTISCKIFAITPAS